MGDNSGHDTVMIIDNRDDDDSDKASPLSVRLSQGLVQQLGESDEKLGRVHDDGLALVHGDVHHDQQVVDEVRPIQLSR